MHVFIGGRVLVPFGKKKIYTGVVVQLHQREPELHKPKPIIDAYDERFAVDEKQLRFWSWISEYYMCGMGEVMNAALPSYLKLQSETAVSWNEKFTELSELSDDEFVIYQALEAQETLNIDDIRKILDRKNVVSVLHGMFQKGAVFMSEELKAGYKPKMIPYVEALGSDEDFWKSAFDAVSRADKQSELLLAFMDMSRNGQKVKKKDLLERVGTSDSVLKALEKKDIVKIVKYRSDRIQFEDSDSYEYELTAEQQRAYDEIQSGFEEWDVCLLHGVTSSGKTEVYIHLIESVLASGKQALYLLPEIALTAQIIQRLKQKFGSDIVMYHSRMTHAERLEAWEKVRGSALGSAKLIVGARSAVFLPFSDLGLIIVDEEHDHSYKQKDPAPRYNGRDSAIWYGATFGAKILLGSATPSMESYRNALEKKYNYVTLFKRYGDLPLPEMQIIDLKKYKVSEGNTLSDPLRLAIRETIEKGKQIILFQNRRGFAPRLECESCGWTRYCDQCDVSTTYHKGIGKLKCHYCSRIYEMPTHCPACGSGHLKTVGFGTEKVEDEIKSYFPEARTQRMDLDTTRGKHAHQNIINSFESGELDILIGTQMVTKGLDFENVEIVGILNADQLLHFPDFRSDERAFQTIQQVAGRGGRKGNRGSVYIQTKTPKHETLQYLVSGNWADFYASEMYKRNDLEYPPFMRLLTLTFRHRDADLVQYTAKYATNQLRPYFGRFIMGPEIPLIGRIKNQYLRRTLIKLPVGVTSTRSRQKIRGVLLELEKDVQMRKVRVIIDVDPYHI
jgi:primosomal protein N' (replication factor Y)